MNALRRILAIARDEVRAFAHRPLFLFTMIIAPVLCVVFFTSLMHAGLPTKLPCALVDDDDTHITRILVRILGSMPETDITRRYHTFAQARQAMQRGEVYAIYHIERGTTAEAIAGRQPRLAFYTNEAYLVPGNMLMRDLRTISELAGLALTRENLYARGATERGAMAVIQAIRIETHPVGNATLDYGVYLNNMVVPGILILLIFLSTSYAISIAWKHGKQRDLYRQAGQSQTVALVGKLLPQTAVYAQLFLFFDVYVYRWLGYPCHCGLWRMAALGLLTVLAAQGFATFLCGLCAGQMRLVMCLCSLWGILSFSLAGFTYPVTEMHPLLRWLAGAFPLRHYYLIYVNQALDGFALHYVARSVRVLALFALMPLLVVRRYRRAFLTINYRP